VDPSYPDRQVLLNLDFKPYLYTNIMAFSDAHFSFFESRMILLFFLVFVTGFFAYLAFRLLGFSRSVSFAVSLIALLPRLEVSGGLFGIFTSYDVVGQAFGLPILWLLTAWFIKRAFSGKYL